MTKMVKTVTILGLSLSCLLAACSPAGDSFETLQAKALEIKKGDSLPSVLADLGQPDGTLKGDDGKTVVINYSRASGQFYLALTFVDDKFESGAMTDGTDLTRLPAGK